MPSRAAELRRQAAEMRGGPLDRVHAEGTPWDLLGRLDELERRISDLQRAAATGLFLSGSTTMQAPGAVLSRIATEPEDGVTLFYFVGADGRIMAWESEDVDGTAQTVVYDSDEVVTKRLRVQWVIAENTGAGVNSNVSDLVPGGNVNLYTDGVDTCQLAVSAAGVVTVSRTAGTDTFKVLLLLMWI